MKILNPLRFTASFALFVLLFSSCTADSLKKERANARSSSKSNNPDDIKMGSIQAKISDQYQSIYMIAFNDSYTSEPVFTDGSIYLRIDDLPIGEYTVQVMASGETGSNSEFNSVTLTNIIVEDNMVTYLGLIERH